MAKRKKLMSERAYELIKEDLARYTRKLAAGYGKVRKRFIGEMLTGIVKSGRCLLSEIARAIHPRHSRVSVHGEEKRLSNELKSERWGPGELGQNYQQVVKQTMVLDTETVIALDLFDVNKDGSHVFEHMTRVYDGSGKEAVDGFWAIAIEAIRGKGEHLPLYMHLFSDKVKGFLSQFTEITKAVESVLADFGRVGLWVMDRGFDSLQNFLYFQGETLSFLIRGCHDRVVERTVGVPEKLLTIVQSMPLRGVDSFFKYYTLSTSRRGRQKWQRREAKVRYDFFPIVVVAGSDEEPAQRRRVKLWVIVTEGVGKAGERAFFFTNIPLETLAEAHHLLKQYARRWSVEEAIRFVKQAFQLEEVRVQNYRGLQRMMTFCMLAYTFLSWVIKRWSQRRKKLFWWLHELTPRRAGEKPPPFVHYRMLLAIQKVLALDFFSGFEAIRVT
jgi:hypothetical protein